MLLVENASNGGSDLTIYRFVNDGSTHTKAADQPRRRFHVTHFLVSASVPGGANCIWQHADLSKQYQFYGGAAGTFGFIITGSKLHHYVSLNSVHEFWG